MDGCHLKSGRTSVCNAWPLGEGNTEETPQVPVIVTYISSQLEAGAAKLALYLFWYWSAPASLPGLRRSPTNTTMHDADRCQLCCYTYTCRCIYNIHTDTSKLCVWDIYFISNIFKCIVTHIYQKTPWNYLEQHEREKPMQKIRRDRGSNLGVSDAKADDKKQHFS